MSDAKVAELDDTLAEWQIYWNHWSTQSRGVAIAIRKELLRPEGLMQLHRLVRSSDGRMIRCRLDWAGHRFCLVNVYAPNSTIEQKNFILALHGQLADSPDPLVIGGDFNFVLDANLDRSPRPDNSRRSPDGAAADWRRHFPGLLDVWSQHRAGRHGFTWFKDGSSHCASRLDRFYVPPNMSSYFIPIRLGAAAHPALVSDHNLVVFALTARTPVVAPRPDFVRIKLRFEAVPQLVDAFKVGLGTLLDSAPAGSDAALVHWYPSFKGRLQALCKRLNAQVPRQIHVTAERARVSKEVQALSDRCETDVSVLPDLLAARQRLAVLDHQAAELASAAARREWLHEGERPGPLLTARLQPPRDCAGVAAIRTPAGTLTSNPRSIANGMAASFAAISAASARDISAQQEVLLALTAAPKLSASQATLLDSPQILEAEVFKALSRARPGTAPGPDGLPMDLFRKYREQFAPILARLFSALAAGGALPPAFHDGIISVLHKSGDRTDPANYRPITLLNADYRAYTRVLASRLSSVLPSIIDAQQTAFLAERRMGDSILLLQLLPRALALNGQGAAVVSCDIRKAYDTACREFLQQVMASLGVGPGFRHMVAQLLTGTRAQALVNGRLSAPANFLAGVRQGCPLAPLLYLFIGQALSCFLRARGVGLRLGPCFLSAAQFADDLTALLPTVAHVPQFMSAMETFGAASGQHLNSTKTRVLLMGTQAAAGGPSGPPTTVDAGNGITLQVVPQLTILGIPIAADPAHAGLGEAPVNWPERLAAVNARCSTLSRLPISGFGRGIASSSYGVSRLLFIAEFCGIPPAPVVQRLQSKIAALVDHQKDPAEDAPRRFHGVAAIHQLGSPASGGFGVLPLAQHLAARHAVLGLRLALGLAARGTERPPWVNVACMALRRLLGSEPHPVAIFGWRPSGSQLLHCPPSLKRIFNGIAQLPPLQLLNPVVPGPWCAVAPLWHNPLLTLLIPGPPLAERFPDLMRLLPQVCDLWMLEFVMYQLSFPAYALPAITALSPAVRSSLTHLHAALPASWTHAVKQVYPSPAPPQQAFLEVAWATLGWRLGTTECLLPALTVRRGTALQLQATMRPHWAKQLAFQQLAHTSGGGAAPAPAGPAPQNVLPALFPALWRLGCGNQVKEIYWRLVLDAIPTAQRRHAAREGCSCGVLNPGRDHHFWHCPVAQRVIEAVASELTAFAARHARPHGAVVTADVWLVRPQAGVLPWIWQLVCLVAIAAMESGRRTVKRLQLGESPPSGSAIILKAGRRAVARMWVLLAEAASGGKLPAGRPGQGPQPFLHYDGSAGLWVPRRAAA